MAGGDFIGIAIIGVLLIGGFLVLKQNPDLLKLDFLNKEEEIPDAPDMESPQEEEQAPEPPADRDSLEGYRLKAPAGPEAEIEPEVTPQYIPVPMIMPVDYGYRFPGYSRDKICDAEFGGSCNSECRHGPNQICRDCVYFSGQPRYKRYPRPDYRPPKWDPTKTGTSRKM